MQIRTNSMHQVAEYGMASHWAYKDQKRWREGKEELYNTPWLLSIKEWQNDMISSRDFVDSVRRELLGKRVFVFLRNGKILNLARGATVIDAAFQIHTEIGLNMHGVEINGKPVPFSYELQNGDVVYIFDGGRESLQLTGRDSQRADPLDQNFDRTFEPDKKKVSGRLGRLSLWITFGSMHLLSRKPRTFLSIFQVPSRVEDLASFLPGKTQYSEVDDVLIALGKNHDRAFPPYCRVSNVSSSKEALHLCRAQASSSRPKQYSCSCVRETQTSK